MKPIKPALLPYLLPTILPVPGQEPLGLTKPVVKPANTPDFPNLKNF